jgi:methionine sulfoxide reductase heme-binding subunit
MQVLNLFSTRRPIWRHFLTIILSGALIYLFSEVHGHWDPMHRWNRATADASFILLTLTMALGPASRLWPIFTRFVIFRREWGIYAIFLAMIHTVIILAGWVTWDIPGIFGLAFHPTLDRYVMVQHGFGLANLIGIVALFYGLALMLTSSDRAVRFLGGPIWKFVQRGAYVLWALVAVHGGYFLFMHFVDYHRAVPPPNPLSWPFVGLVALVLTLRSAAFFQVWRQARRDRKRTLPLSA